MEYLKRGLSGVALAALVGLAAWRGGQIDSPAHWYAILPPLLAVVLALVTRQLLLSLGLGVLVGGLLATVPGNAAAAAVWGRGLLTGPGYVLSALSDTVNLQILAFVVLVLMMISVLIVAGGLQGVVNLLARFARGPRSTQMVTALMGLAIFIDDYANTMIVGSSMRPMSDRHRISREKLAFLVDATSAPVAGVAVVSTWIGYEVGLFGEVSRSLEIGLDGYRMFFDALSFRFYCFMMIIFVLVNVISGRDFGSMRTAQTRARTSGSLAAPDARPVTSKSFSRALPHDHARVAARTALIPLLGLFIFLLGALWVDGGGMSELEQGAQRILNPRIWRDVLGRASNNIFILALASGVGLLLALATSRLQAGLPWRLIGRTLLAGFRASLLPMAILVLAWSLKGTCDALQTGVFLVDAVGEVLSPLWFPALLFVIASLTAIATGTSWGTMAILIPTGIPIAFQLDGGSYGLTTMMSLGAVLDGAILGDHCSPISDTTIMSSISSSCDHIHHVRTQIPYSLTVGGLAIVCGYLPAASGLPSWAGMLIATGVIVALFGFIRRRSPGSQTNDRRKWKG
jgi:Na+/H+ antiporter NhaC